MKLRSVLIALMLTVLAGCVSIEKIGPGQVTVKEMSIMLEGSWNKFESGLLLRAPGATQIWTREGFALDILAFFAGISEGEALGQDLTRAQKKMPVYRLKMAPHEIVEAFETNITQDGSLFKLGKLEPVRFAGGDGFRFEYELRRKADSLVFSGVGYATVANKKLYLMSYSAPRTHYYGKLLPGFEAAARSASLKR
jgi:hypothetical protein